MKRQVSICIFLAIIVIILALLYIKISNDNRNDYRIPAEEPETELTELESPDDPSVTISQEYSTFYFYAKDDEGRVAIYDVKSQSLYMETGIETAGLPENIRKELEVGIFFKDEIELFNFLENYSS